MKKIITAFTFSLLPLTATATEPKVWKDAPLAADQRLPHGLTLVPGSHVIDDPSGGAPNASTGEVFLVKIPSTSGHGDYWSLQYATQLENLGWSTPLAIPASPSNPPIKMLTRQSENKKCNEQMMVVSLGPEASAFVENGSTPAQIEFDFIVFQYSTTGECEAKD